MLTSALYYPYIQISDNLWLRRAILYWDRISPIVPWEVEKEIPQKHVSRELKSYGVLDFINPEDILEGQEGQKLSESFLKIIDSKEFTLKIGPPEKRRYDCKIHRDKFADGLLDKLRDKDLFKEGGPWQFLETNTGRVYMGFLASYLANHLRLEPITDSTDYQKGFLQSHLTPSDKSTTVSASLVLEELLPAPKEAVPVKKLLKFKEKHERELLAFRRVTRDTIESIRPLTEERQREKIESVKDEIKEQCLVLSRKLKENRIETFLNCLLVPFKISMSDVGAIGATTISVPIGATVLGVHAGIKIVREVFRGQARRHSILETTPYTYVFNVRKKLA
ncbi:MAG TPA: DUF6236 family protein [Candidatus Tripitaka californicus]|uniref:DUF6236 family protein n=1 Tax=Candidatus Tripitaka californicus TaxID=3367616 RepID=UPI0040267D94|nr:hypothetical protein [Planctomycetota bacterium]